MTIHHTCLPYPFTRRVALSCLVVLHLFLASQCVFCGPLGKRGSGCSVVLYTGGTSPPSWRSFVSFPPTILRYIIFVFTVKKLRD